MDEYLTTLNYKAEKAALAAADALAARKSAESGVTMTRADLIHHAIRQIQESPERLTNYIQKLMQENLHGKA